ncbi:DNA/RNA-binding domain of Phe-tRNA-synthetase-like protein [Leucobacter luti]|uniref:B3/B4 domain-containing protein n=1 Tax=Leucobacter luti TaxID=340320 RepID=UPI0010D38408|nr:phenylalanine--tRNA ligase beta subunit-related protein [Leucobacter luti]MCW2289380.1 DNA/RNA-binding domain of Phe-tRNA-synthetase-like protein [Leucobacter luti]TCK39940.1 DNA/RNA-binding domain of Phe-tRNA-synthetase-like protein [Leucobacter luti]
MAEPVDAAAFLDACRVDPAVQELRGDYRAVLIVVEGIVPERAPVGPGAIDALVAAAEAHARALLAQLPVTELPHIAAWREAYQAFGAKPQRTRNSLEALTRRAESGLPRVNPLTDIYNAISVLHQIPLGGEDLLTYQGPAQLVRAAGDEPFDAIANGEATVEYPEPGEVIWRDNAGVTCRRWNWRQGRRTALTEQTTSALFICDSLAPMSDAALAAAADALTAALRGLGPDVRATRRVVTA